MAEKKLNQNIDYTMVTKRKSGYLVELIYPNEDSVGTKDAITIWTSHHLYNPETDGNIDNFVNVLECTAYIEDGATVEEFIPNGAIWFKSQKDLEQNLSTLKIGDVAIAPYK